MQFLISAGIAFHKCEALTEKHNCPKALVLRGTAQSPLMTDLVVLIELLLVIYLFSGGGALPFKILKIKHASLYLIMLSQLRSLCFSRILQ